MNTRQQMTGRRRRELGDSFRLLGRDEQWFLRDLLVGVAVLAVWVAATGVLATRLASALDLALGLGAGESPSRAVIAVFGVLWLLLPAIAVVRRLRTRTLNLRGNVEQYYRLAHPAALLAPPAVLVLASGVLVLALGALPWYAAFVLVPVGLFALVRTLAFSYRVYSFSHPLVVQLLAGLSTVLLLGSSLVALGIATDRRALVDQVLLVAGLPTWIAGTVSVEGVAISGVAAVALVPLLLALAYVLVQTVVALGVRLFEPDLDRSKMRTGQRYPPFLPEVTSVQPSTTPDSADSVAPETDSDTTPVDGTAAGSDDVAAADATDDTVEGGESEGEDLDDVSNTRVFTPPAGDDSSGLDAGTGTDAGATTGAGTSDDAATETRAVRSDEAGDATSETREYCDACGESFSVDTTVRFCPNCGGAL